MDTKNVISIVDYMANVRRLNDLRARIKERELCESVAEAASELEIGDTKHVVRVGNQDYMVWIKPVG
jgi:trans-2-enoyl-CoA reductase